MPWFIPAAKQPRIGISMYLHTPRRRTLFGLSAGTFKYNPTAGTRQILHLATVKPNIVTVPANFNLLTPFSELAAGEFSYESEGGYLKISNPAAIDISLVPADVPSDSIDMAAGTDYPTMLLVGVHHAPVLIN